MLKIIQVWVNDVVPFYEIEEELKKVWKNLIDQFRNIYNAHTCTRSGQGFDEDSFESVKWTYFKNLLFLKDIVARRE